MTHVSVDLGAYRSNLETLAHTVGPSMTMAVVKANAYGHGLLPISRVALEAGVHWLGALDVITAMQLRSAGIRADARILAWHLTSDAEYREIIENNIDLGVSTVEQLQWITAASAPTPARIHLKIDTGLHRNGALPEEWPDLVSRALELERAGVVELFGAWTHIAEASFEEDSAAMSRFDNAVAVAESLGATFELLHLAASAAGFERADSRYGLVRFGAFSYGISPGGGIAATDLGLTPVMTLETVSQAGPDGSIILPLGFGSGISSRAAGRVRVLIGEQLADVAQVELDHMVLRGRRLRPGNPVVMFGSGDQGEWTLQQWADATDTIGEEIVTRLAADITRKYRN